MKTLPMKTLDELIKAQERCSKYPNCHFCFLHSGPICQWIQDTLYYLKEYRDRKEKLRYWNEKAISEQQNLSDAYMFYKTALEKDNPPLTWSELQQMEGKPIWTEDIIHEKGEWLLVHIVVDNDIWYVDKWADKERLNRDGYGKLWQAYRKERE